MTKYSSKIALSLAATAGVLGLLSCLNTGNDAPIRIKSAHPFKTLATGGACEFDDSISISGGSLDVARGNYTLWFDVQNETQAIETQSGGEVLAGDSRNDFYVKRVNFRYAASNGTAFEPETEMVHSVIAPQGGSKFGMNLIGDKAADRLATTVLPATPAFQLAVSIDMSGNLASSNTELTSNRITFPLTIYNSGFVGCGGFADGGVDRIAPTGPCGGVGGQDGPILCCSSPAAEAFCE